MSISNLREIAPNLVPSGEGWWKAPGLSEVSYPEEGNSLCFQVEDSSFWFAHRNRCIVESMRLYRPPGTLFDVGGGNGAVACAIQNSGLDVVLIEPGIQGVRNAVKRGIQDVVHATLEDVGLLPDTLPAVGLFDVVEHIRDHQAFLSQVHRLLVSGGRVYITVPAYQWLWSHEDILAGHERRYTGASLRDVLQRAGYTVEFSSYFFGFLPLPTLFRRVLPHRLGFAPKQVSEKSLRADHEVGNPAVRRALEKLGNRELAKIRRGVSIRMGGSCLAVARKG